MLDLDYNPFYQKEQLIDWIASGLDYAAGIQGPDGSWDEFYPNEKGFGATALVVWGGLSVLALLGDTLPPKVRTRAMESMAKGALCIGQHQKKVGFLANHYAFALAALHRARQLLDETGFRPYYEDKLSILDSLYHQEGWHTEYDGLDVGYQSTTVSFLGKIYRDTKDPKLLERVEPVCEFLTHFFYPNGHFAGAMGCRQTLHAYLHGLEVFSAEIPAAAALADRIERSLAAGLIVHPETQSDRYVHYRVEDFLLTALDFNEDKDASARLPLEQEGNLDADFPEAGVSVRKRQSYYMVTNFARGGVTKIFALPSGRLLWNDAGVLVRTEQGKLLSSQWIGEDRQVVQGNKISYAGQLYEISEKSFNPGKFMLMRAFVSTLARSPAISNEFKGLVRKILMLQTTESKIAQRRLYEIGDHKISLEIELQLKMPGVTPQKVVFGGEWFTRYVPQSRFFQYQELDCRPIELNRANVRLFNRSRVVRLKLEIDPRGADSIAWQLTFPDSSEIAASYTTCIVDQFSDWAGGKSRYLWQRRIDAVLPHLPLAGTLLDAGCGDEATVAYLREQRPDLKIMSCDLSPLAAEGFSRADVRKLPFGDSTFDAMTMMAVIEHVPDHRQALSEAFRVLRPGGALIITTPNPLYGLPTAVAGRIGLKYKEGFDNSIKADSLATIAAQQGFTVEEQRGFLVLPFASPLEGIERGLNALPGGSKILMNQFLKLRRPSA